MPKQILAAYQQIVQKDLDETLKDNEWLKEEIQQVHLQNEMLRHRLKLISEEHARNLAFEEEKARREVEDQLRYEEWLSHEETRRTAEQAERWRREAEEQRHRAEHLEKEIRTTPQPVQYRENNVPPPWQPPKELEVNVLQARDLIPADKSTMAADPFVTLSFEDGIILHKTHTIQDTLQPTWNSKGYLAVPPQARCLTICVYDEDVTKEADFIGWASLPLNQKTVQGEHILDLMPRPDVPKDQKLLRNRVNLGQIRLQIKPSNGIHTPSPPPLPQKNNVEPNSIPPDTIYVDVLKGSKLRDVDYIGKSDPFVSIGFDNKPKIVRTKTIANTQNPLWNESFEISIPPGAKQLLFSVRDEDTSVSEIIGEGTIDLTQVHRYRSPEWLDLSYEKKGKRIASGQIFLKIKIGNRNIVTQKLPSMDLKPRGRSKSYLDLTIIEADGLAKQDLIGKSDPFVELYWGNNSTNIVKKTKTINNDQSPKWNTTWNDLELPSESISHIKLMVYDEDIGSNDFLGTCQVELNPAENGDRWIPLVPRKNSSEDYQLMVKNKGTLGRIHINMCFRPSTSWAPGGSNVSTNMNFMNPSAIASALTSTTSPGIDTLPTKLKLTIVQGENMIPRDSLGKSDPYVFFTLDDLPQQPTHKTKHIDNTLNPFWNQTFLVDVPANISSLIFSAMDHDTLNKDDFLGRAVLELRDRRNADVYLNLLPRPNEEEDFKLQRKYGGLGRLKIKTEWH